MAEPRDEIAKARAVLNVPRERWSCTVCAEEDGPVTLCDAHADSFARHVLPALLDVLQEADDLLAWAPADSCPKLAAAVDRALAALRAEVGR